VAAAAAACIEQLPSKAPFSKRFEEIVGEACESAAASQVARRFHLPETTVRAIDLRYLERWDQRRRKPALKQMGVDGSFGKETACLDNPLSPPGNLTTTERPAHYPLSLQLAPLRQPRLIQQLC
jgi:hypothetical protein